MTPGPYLDHDVVDLFGGPGGWAVGGKQHGLTNLGIDTDWFACQTRKTARYGQLHADVSVLDPFDFNGVQGLVASPPCQGLSTAGLMEGLADCGRVLQIIEAGPEALLYIPTTGWKDARTPLILEPLRWVLQCRPRWCAFEQVPTALAVWEAMAVQLEQAGYDVDTGMLHAEAFGVGQARRRAFLIASLDGPVVLPAPTHSRYYSRYPTRSDHTVPASVTMAEALDWVLPGTPRPVAAQQVAQLMAADPWREANRSGATVPLGWPGLRPSTTVLGKEVIQHPGANQNRFNGAAKTRNDGLRVHVFEAAALQGFDPAFPFQGPIEGRYQQIADAVPPPLAAAVIGAALRRPAGAQRP